MRKKIESFEYIWNLDENIGHIKYHFIDGRNTKWIKYSDKSEFQIIITTLINIDPVYLIKTRDKLYLSTGVESIGETGRLELI